MPVLARLGGLRPPLHKGVVRLKYGILIPLRAPAEALPRGC